MPNPVLIQDLEARFRSLDSAEQNMAQALLDDAWAVLTMTVPDLEDRMAAGTVSLDGVVFVVSAMALRVLRNPDGYKRMSVDDTTLERDSSLSAGALYVSPDEVALLTGRASSSRRGAFSIAPYQEAPRAPASEAEYIDYLRYGARW